MSIYIPLLRRPSVRPASSSSGSVHNFKHLLLRNRLANQNQSLRGPSMGRGPKNCSRQLSQMTKMAVTPIYMYGKKNNLQNLLLWNQLTDFHETWYASGTRAHYCYTPSPTPPHAKRSFRGYTVYSLPVIPSFRDHFFLRFCSVS